MPFLVTTVVLVYNHCSCLQSFVLNYYFCSCLQSLFLFTTVALVYNRCFCLQLLFLLTTVFLFTTVVLDYNPLFLFTIWKKWKKKKPQVIKEFGLLLTGFPEGIKNSAWAALMDCSLRLKTTVHCLCKQRYEARSWCFFLGTFDLLSNPYCNICLFVCPIITQEPIDRFASTLDLGAR